MYCETKRRGEAYRKESDQFGDMGKRASIASNFFCGELEKQWGRLLPTNHAKSPGARVIYPLIPLDIPTPIPGGSGHERGVCLPPGPIRLTHMEKNLWANSYIWRSYLVNSFAL
jgi:hypothetical protein